MKKIEDYFNEEAVHHDDIFIQNMGMTEFYDEIENQINKSENKARILVLGCGTGLEIERIKFNTQVTAVDISKNMLDELKKRKLHEQVSLKTVCGSLLEMDFGIESYDIVLSCYVMHHFNEEQKNKIYQNIFACLTDGGVFINGDTMAKNHEEEMISLKEAEDIYAKNNLPFASLHVDAPFCLEHETEVLKKSGFTHVKLEKEWQQTKLYRAIK